MNRFSMSLKTTMGSEILLAKITNIHVWLWGMSGASLYDPAATWPKKGVHCVWIQHPVLICLFSIPRCGNPETTGTKQVIETSTRYKSHSDVYNNKKRAWKIWSRFIFCSENKSPICASAHAQGRLKQAQKQSANKLANCWQQTELASILANLLANFFVLVNSNLTCERLENMCW